MEILEGTLDMVEDLQNRARIREPEKPSVTNFYPLEPDVPSSDRSKKNSFSLEKYFNKDSMECFSVLEGLRINPKEAV